jgi:hypothetical protein
MPHKGGGSVNVEISILTEALMEILASFSKLPLRKNWPGFVHTGDIVSRSIVSIGRLSGMRSRIQRNMRSH